MAEEGVLDRIAAVCAIANLAAGLSQGSWQTMGALGILALIGIAASRGARMVGRGPLFKFLAYCGACSVIMMFCVAFIPLFM